MQINQYLKNQEDILKRQQLIEQAKNLYEENNYSLTKISEIVNVDRHIISKELKRFFNFSVRGSGKKKINSDIFEEIDTEEKAYWLGFLYADGYVSKNNKLELCLQESDINHVEKFKAFMSSDHKISKKTTNINDKTYISYRLSIQDIKICNDLKKHGCGNKKTFTISFPDINQNLIRHFIRGYFDGDGCISLNEGNKFLVLFTSGSINFLTKLQTYIKDLLDIDSAIRKDNRSQAVTLVLTGGIKKYSKFLEYIYDESKIYLDRKYEKYLECRLRSKNMRRSKIISAELSEKTGV